MNVKDFLYECSRSPLFRNIKIKITENVLEEYNFKKDKYELEDLRVLYRLITAPQLKSIEPSELQKIPEKHLWHREIIKHLKKQQDIIEERKKLGMPNIIAGFRIDREPDISIVNSATNPKKYELASSWLLNRSSEFRKWLHSCYLKYGINETKKRIRESVYKVLEKWNLPDRYDIAIEELILFNRIIPAHMGLRYHYKRHPFREEKFEKWIKIDGDLSIAETKERLKRDAKFSFLKAHNENLLSVRRRRKKRSQIRNKVLELYAKYKGEVNVKGIPQKIKRDLWKEKISIDAIKKIIKRG